MMTTIVICLSLSYNISDIHPQTYTQNDRTSTSELLALQSI